MIDRYKKIRDIAYPPHKREYGRKLIFSIFCRSISTLLAILCSKLKLTPNAVSLISIVSGCLGIYLLFSGELIPGAVLSANSKLLDCVDGELARITGKISKIGGWLEPLNSNLQYLFVLPAIACFHLKVGVVTIELVFTAFIASGVFVAVRGIYNTDLSGKQGTSYLKTIILCQFKHNHDLRRENRTGALLYYLRYNLISQNGVMYPMLIILAVYFPAGMIYYVYYFIIVYLIFFFITFTGVWFGKKLLDDL